MFVICVTFKLKENTVATFMPLMMMQAKNSLDLEDGCHVFDVCVATDTPSTVFLYEVYSNKDAFELHLMSEHFKKFDAAVAGLIQEKTVTSYVRQGEPV